MRKCSNVTDSSKEEERCTYSTDFPIWRKNLRDVYVKPSKQQMQGGYTFPEETFFKRARARTITPMRARAASVLEDNDVARAHKLK
jgi:hypothetical protein